ncbi:hypothetical protein NEUTE1DRAFT_139103 [Neurospora tetrasperma FGSC 2508]|uniref:Uncharacterized protein n=1 Tax=Neurospora tetrasperma (strain FGSC 2508 / ATCC MYA-4615 / P0657) TaxID=510951 RepID=F8MNY9_NEUT8|nr:uncharacterized protein NEUTE1DRAFT_139103 [Neurospora tetrasperma FGSC 2508]EGO57054.1 hypothetical protein NEUTE1DRAFT_139103 [Neurospora tetrasperma FGSC 2508]
MGDVHHSHPPTNEFSLYHATLPSRADYLKESSVVSETEIHLKDNAAAIPRTLFPSEAETLSYEQQHKVVLQVTKRGSLELSIDHHAAQKDQLEPIQNQNQDQNQDRDQDHLTLLTSLNKQTTSLLQIYSQSQSKSEEGGDTNVLEQAVVLGQVALVLASSLIAVSATSGDDRVVCRLDLHSKARVEIKVEVQTQVQREVVVALANMGVALVKQFDRTGDRRDLEEAGWIHARDGGYSREREPHLAQPQLDPYETLKATSADNTVQTPPNRDTIQTSAQSASKNPL